MNRTVKPEFQPFACGCVPYVDTQSYEGWHQFGLQVPRGVKGQKPIRVSDGKPGRESLWCKCVVEAPVQRVRRATRVAPPTIPAAAVAAAPRETAATVDRELYEVAQRIQQNVEAGLLDDILGARETPTEPEVVTVVAHPMTRGGDRVRTITNATVLEARATTNRFDPRAPRTRPQRANTNEIGAAPEGAMPLADMLAHLA